MRWHGVLEFGTVRWARLVLAVALLGGCSGGRDDDTLPPPVSTSSTTLDYSVPAVIDAAYVERVMAALDRVYGDAIRTLATERTITEEFLERLAAIYTEDEFGLAQDIWVKDLADGLKGLRPVPGDPKTTVQRLVRAESSCVIAAVERDFSSTRETPDVPTPQEYIALVPRADEDSTNPTPWLIAFDGFKDDGSEPQQPCE